jgi:AcrR family transcriptional regulator
MAPRPSTVGSKADKSASRPGGRRRSESGEAIRQRIKIVATEMFVRHGYNGVTFLDLAKELGINHSLVHYHFGTKADLALEVLEDFAESGIQENRLIWGDPHRSLFDKFVAARDRIYRRFILLNPTGTMQHPTGLVSRFAMDAESITPELRKLVQKTHEALDDTVLEAVRIAIQRKELVRAAPAELIMLHISSILYVAGPTARYGWEFTRLDNHFRGTLDMIMRAYGARGIDQPEWPPIKRTIRRAPAKKPAVQQSEAV